MNLFRSEEHVKNWSGYDPISEESIMPVADWVKVFSTPVVRTRLGPDYLSHAHDDMGTFFGALAELGRSGAFWLPG
jgi:hypothetical protein